MQGYKNVLIASMMSGLVGCCSVPYDNSVYLHFEQQLAATKPVYVPDDEFVKRMKSMSYLEVLASVTTPAKVKRYVRECLAYEYDTDVYGDDYWASFRVIHARKRDDCDGGAIAAAALLNESKYEVYLLKVQESKENGSAHMVCVYETNEGLFGCISITERECMTQEKDLTTILSLFGKEFDEYRLKNVSKYRSLLRFGKGDLSVLKKLIDEGDYDLLPKIKQGKKKTQ